MKTMSRSSDPDGIAMKENAERLHRRPTLAIAGLVLIGASAELCRAQSDVRLPQGVKAVWDLGRAHRETTATRERICINGLWRWQPVGKMTDEVPSGRWGYLKVPGPWPGTSYWMHRESQTHYPHPGWKNEDLRRVDMAWYQREITVPKEWAGRRIAVYTEYLNSYAAVYVDGKKAGEIAFPWGEVDITSACRPGGEVGSTRREPQGRSARRTTTLSPPRGRHLLSLYTVALPLNEEIVSYAAADGATRRRASVTRRGLCGDVFLISTPAGSRIADVKVDTSVRRWEITFDAAVNGLRPGRTCSLRARITRDGSKVREFKSRRFTAADLKTGRFAFTSAWRPARLWDVHTPENVYYVQMSLLDSRGSVLDVFRPVRFGFREFWTDGRDFRLNGTRFFCFAIPLDNAQIGARAASYEGARRSMLRLKTTGVNTVYTHNYGCQPGVHLGFEELLKAADDVGMLISMSQPHASSYDWKAPDADDTNGYARHAEFYVRMVQNHPSVVMYSLNHNMMGYSHDMNPHLIDGLHNNTGKRGPRADRNATLARRTEEIVKRFDPTRVIYHHSSGNLGQMYTSNFYINFVPIQERSDWFEHWATEGVKPVFLCEYGVPLAMSWTMHRGWETGVLGKGKRSFTNAKLPYQFCTAEWGSQFLGDSSYRLTEEEKANLRFEAKKWRAGAAWFRWDYPFRVHSAPLGIPNLSAVQAMYITDSWRAYRTWGVSAFNIWSYGNLWKLRKGVDTGRKTFEVDWDGLQKPGFSPDFIERRYERIDTAYELSDWTLTSAGEAFIRNNQPLLAYIAGKPERFTSKDHNFHPGETVEKQVVIINNSRETVRCECAWSFDVPQPVTGRQDISVRTGEQGRIPLRFALPRSLGPGAYPLRLNVTFSDGSTQEDAFTVHVLPRRRSPELRTKIAVYDPVGETVRLLEEMRLSYEPIEADTDLSAYGLLVIGKGALTLGGPAPNIARIREGLRVLVFEQKGPVLEKRFGFRVQEYGLRRVFKRVPDHPALAGLDTEHLRDWRGEATLVPPRLEYAFSQYSPPVIEWCGLKVTRGWRCGCRGNVATVLIEKPGRGDFLPIVDGGFNLQYSPLMEYREGKGLVVFCQLDVTGRTEREPAARRLARNILAYMEAYEAAPRRQALYVGGPAGRAHLESAGVRAGEYAGGVPASNQVLVVGPGGARTLSAHARSIATWLKSGGHLLALGLDARAANAFLPFRIATRNAEHIDTIFEPAGVESLLAGIGPAEVMIRDPRPVPLITGGAAPLGNGVLATAPDANVVFCQLAPWQFDHRKSYHVKITFRRTSFLLARLLGNMGVGGSTPLVERCASPVATAVSKEEITDPLWLEKGGQECVLPLYWKGLPLGEGAAPPPGWKSAGLDDSRWRRIRVPGVWEEQFKDLADLNGLFLYRVKFTLPTGMATGDVTLVLGAIDDEDWTYINGALVGSLTAETNPRDYWKAIRRYRIPAGVLKAGDNVLAVKVNDLRQAGGIKGLRTERQQRRLTRAGTAGPSVLKNGDFSVDRDDDGLADQWSSEATGKASFTRQKTPAGTWSARIDCTDLGGQRGHAMLAQMDVPVEKDQWYVISLDARAENLRSDVKLTVTNTKTWRFFFPHQGFAPTEAWKRFTFKVTSNGTATSRTRFQIWYTGTGRLWLADVRMEPCQPPWFGRWSDGFYLDEPVEMDDPYRFFRW